MSTRAHFVVTLAACFVLAAAAQANSAPILIYGNSLSFNAVSTVAGMGVGETAGAPGFNVPRWNNMVASGSSPFNGTLTAGTIMDAQNTGAAAATALTYSFVGALGGGNSGANDQRMFDNEWDPFGATPDLTITVTNIPFANYQVVTYHHSANFTANDRGGDVSANSIVKALRMFQQDSDNPNGPYGYVEADFDGPFDTVTPGNVPRGTYVHFDELFSGDLVLTVNDRLGARLRFSGFQIIETTLYVPEPSTLTIAAMGLMGIVGFRRRRRSCQG